MRALSLYLAALLAMLTGCARQGSGAATPGAASKGPLFVEIGTTCGTDFQHVHGGSGKHHFIETANAGVALFDYDEDGDLDIYFTQCQLLDSPPDPKLVNRVYRNDGNNHFTPVTGTGLEDPGYGMGVAVGDYDRDGHEDVYVTNYGPNCLFHNLGGGHFVNVAKQAGVADRRLGSSCTFLDYDNDGDLDLFVGNYLDQDPRDDAACRYMGQSSYCPPQFYKPQANVLYHNNGDGTFTDVSATSGIRSVPPGRTLGCLAADLDNDGDIEIYETNDGMANYLFDNVGGRFRDVGMEAGIAYGSTGEPLGSMGVDAGDTDGDLDVTVATFSDESFQMQNNQGGLRFRDTANVGGIARDTFPALGFGALFIDFDLDGDLDVFYANGSVFDDAEKRSAGGSWAQQALLFHNDGQGVFSKVPPEEAGPYFAQRFVGRGTARGDLDGDGDEDIVVNNCVGRPVVLINQAHANYLKVRLRATTSSPSAIGARVWATVAGRKLYRQVVGGGSFCAASSRDIVLGLGQARQVDELLVAWPSGKKSRLPDIACGQTIVVAEP